MSIVLAAPVADGARIRDPVGMRRYAIQQISPVQKYERFGNATSHNHAIPCTVSVRSVVSHYHFVRRKYEWATTWLLASISQIARAGMSTLLTSAIRKEDGR